MTTTLAVANQKGGVGKTTTVASLGIALVERGLRVLLVDLDPQGGLTFSLGIDPEDVELTAGDVMLGRHRVTEALVVTDEGVHLLPSSIALTRAEEQLVGRTGRERRLSVALDAVAADYDWILVDCPPTLGVLTVGALAAADEVIVPLQCETLSHRGVGQLLDTIHDVQQLLNPRLRVLGVLPTAYDGRTRHARAVLETIGETYGLDVLEPAIPKSVRFAEAPAIGRSVLGTSPRHKGAEAYRAVAARLVDRTPAPAVV
ncbi:ParA family protein [Aeromicrobium sp. IC_218]|uniref:ParA family protein n=1 Tax=Aeromicrobium sp. IC_218 TaxID=2545468 RepID=UPI0010407E79|nr:ParA family protein [Aeromicrobium sp. IC_218]TCI98910.1 ParA family protein [Aeromicrobium sp. IC_218]